MELLFMSDTFFRIQSNISDILFCSDKKIMSDIKFRPLKIYLDYTTKT